MVSGLGSYVKLLSTELALKAIQTQDSMADAPSCDDKQESVSSIDARNPVTLSELSSEKAPATGHLDSQIAPEHRIATAAFMTNLKAQLQELYRNAESSSQAGAMLRALEKGTLNIFDPIEGVSVTAWDATSGAHSQQRNQVEMLSSAGWSQFLKERVKRGDDGSYFKEADGHYIDAVSGEKAYFETIENKYYYFTWL